VGRLQRTVRSRSPRAAAISAGVGGLHDRYPEINGVDITVYNDGDHNISVRPHTFAEIADLIERYL